MRTVLIVEDNPVTRKVVRVALGAAGFRVVEAEDAAAAISAVKRQRPHLILQDLVLPDLDGLELVSRLRAMPGCDEVPILALTGFLGRLDEPRFELFTDIIVKPVEPSRLTDIVRSYLPPDEEQQGPGRGRRVLVVDDDRVQLRLQRAILRSLGFEADTAVNVESALARARQSRPDVILSDVLMPDTDGFTFCAHVRRDPELGTIPVVLVTSRTPEPADIQLARQIGASALVQRTPDLKEALEAITAALAAGPGPAASADSENLAEEHRRRLLRQLERQVGVTQELAQRCAVQGAILTSIASLSSALARRARLEEALDEVLYALIDISDASRGAIFLGSGGNLGLGAALGFSDSQRTRLVDLFGCDDLLRRAMGGDDLIAIPSADVPRAAAQTLLREVGAATAILVPLVARGEPEGVLLLGSNLHALHERQWHAFARTVGVQLGHALSLNHMVARLAASELRHRTLLEHAEDAIFQLSDRDCVVETNERGETLMGRSRRDIVGRPLIEFIAAEQRAAVVAWLAEIRREGHGRLERTPLVRADGRLVMMEVSARAVTIEGACVLFLIARDTTERDRLELQLRQAQKMEAIGQLTGGVAHDFNNLLTGILGYTEFVLKDTPQNSPRWRDLDQIRQAGRSAAALTRQLLAFSRQQVLQPAVIALNDVALKVDNLLRRVIGEDIELQTELQPSIPAVLADPGQLEQVLMNLAVNARDAMPEGGTLTIATGVAKIDDAAQDDEEVPPGRYVVLSVADTGCGMSDEVRSRIFEPFFTTKKVGEGTGMGLATVYGIVRQSGGHVTVESQVNRGTTFRVYFPPATDAGAPAEDAIERPIERGCGRVLLVEDATLVRTLARDVLQASGFEVTEASTPEDALRLAGGLDRIDVLLTDVVMPGLNGRELANRLKTAWPAMKVLLMSGYAGSAVQQRELLQPGEAFLEKPFMPQDLVTRVKELLNES